MDSLHRRLSGNYEVNLVFHFGGTFNVRAPSPLDRHAEDRQGAGLCLSCCLADHWPDTLMYKAELTHRRRRSAAPLCLRKLVLLAGSPWPRLRAHLWKEIF